MMDILEELSSRRRQDLSVLAAPRDFKAAFEGNGLHVIAEVKRASPSEGMIREDFDPVAIAKGYAANGAAAISVLCEPHRFLGSDRYLEKVRRTVDVPVLYKDFLTTPFQVLRARARGADACLLIAAVLADAEMVGLLKAVHDLGMTALVETHTEEEVKRAVQCGAKVIGVNCRDLRTFRTDPAITAELIAKIPEGIVKIGESGLKTHEDLLKVKSAGADGFLIGTTLMRAQDPGAKLKELISND